jgi:hypothetical protein
LPSVGPAGKPVESLEADLPYLFKTRQGDGFEQIAWVGISTQKGLVHVKDHSKEWLSV